MNETTAAVPITTPPAWFNRAITVLLKTPGVQRILGRTLALVTFEGRTTGRSYTTPVTYLRDGKTVLFVTKRMRMWWRNLESKPNVEMRLAGISVRGHAEVFVGDITQLPVFVGFLEARRHDAKAYGVTFEANGRVNESEARAALTELVIVKVGVTDQL